MKKPANNLMESAYPNEVHEGIVCDGCYKHPIIGVRYKCTVLEKFDFCENCEATKEHPYAFLKIKRAKDAPKTNKKTLLSTIPYAKPNMDVNNSKPKVEVNNSKAVVKDYIPENLNKDKMQMNLRCQQLEQENKKLKDMLKAECEMSDSLRKK